MGMRLGRLREYAGSTVGDEAGGAKSAAASGVAASADTLVNFFHARLPAGVFQVETPAEAAEES